MQSNMTMMERVIINGTVVSCMAIYLGDNDGACHSKRNGGKLHGNISQNGYGNAIIGRYGGCFEEGIW